MMDFDAWRFWLDLLAIVISALVWIYVRRSNADKATVANLNELKTEIHAMAQDIGKLDERLRHAIGHPDLEPIYSKMNDMKDSMTDMSGEFREVKHTLHLIQEFMLTGGKR